jgi:hypothetical protein
VRTALSRDEPHERRSAAIVLVHQDPRKRGRTRGSPSDSRTAFPDGFLPTLTVRTNPEDARVPIPNADWSFASCQPGDAARLIAEAEASDMLR